MLLPFLWGTKFKSGCRTYQEQGNLVLYISFTFWLQNLVKTSYCNYSEKYFRLPNNLTKHKKTHTVTSLGHLLQMFTTPGQLKAHLKTHREERLLNMWTYMKAHSDKRPLQLPTVWSVL